MRVVYLARDVMILMGANTLGGPLEGVGPENRDLQYWGTCYARCHFRAQKSRDLQGPTPSNGPSYGFAPIKIIKSKRHIKKQVHWQFYVDEFCGICILYSVWYCML